jgi:hypothetical protein
MTERIVLFLMPFFVGVSDDVAAVRRAITDSLDAFGTTGPAELLAAAQAIAFGLSALDTLAEAHVGGHPEATRIRLRACAVTLQRSALLCERALKKRSPAKAPNVPAAPADAIEKPGAGVRSCLAARAPDAPDRNRIWANALREVAGDLAAAGVPACGSTTPPSPPI